MSDSIYAEASLKLYQIPVRKLGLVNEKKRTCHFVVKKITHAAAQSVLEYVWRVK